MTCAHRIAASFAIVLCAIVAGGQAVATPAAVTAGSSTTGGVVSGTRILTVTNLDDEGNGSFRWALAAKGPRVVVFGVGGVIRLKSDLRIRNPDVTIAGQTAPDPGITVTGGSLRINAHDVVVQHIAIRPGPANSAKLNDNRDGISINGQRENASYAVRVENVSVSWSVDEALSTWYATTRDVTIRNSIVAQALRSAGHSKGQHSMGLLVGKHTTGIEVTGNLLASNVHRNPVMGAGSSAFVANNYIVNPGLNAIHFYSHDGSKKVSTVPTLATVVENVVVAGPSTSKGMNAVRIPADMAKLSPDARLFIEGNLLKGRDKNTAISNGSRLPLLQAPAITAIGWKVMPARDVEDHVLRYAGSRPSKRNAVDARLIDDIAHGRERIIDDPGEGGGVAVPSEVRGRLDIPPDPDGATQLGMSRLAAWLCLKHLEVGGPPTPECALDTSALWSALL